MKITVKSILHAMQDAPNAPVVFKLFESDMTRYGYAIVQPVEIELTLPDDFNMTRLLLSALDRERDQAHAEFRQHIESINRRLATLQAIELAPGGPS